MEERLGEALAKGGITGPPSSITWIELVAHHTPRRLTQRPGPRGALRRARRPASAISSRIGRTSSIGLPAGSGSSQST